MPRVLLFDIDNTLLYTGGAGGYAMNRAFTELFGIAEGFAGVEFSGRTDRYILEAGLRRHGIDGEFEEHLSAFTRRYYQLLRESLRERKGHLMPGFPALLEALSAEPNVRIGLATGNFSEAARMKLEYYGIDSFFAGGGFGEESSDRSLVVRSAVERLGDGARPQDILVIGDTPHDIRSALDNGVVAVGVATGSSSVGELRAAGAQLTFPDFGDWETAAAVLLGRR